MKFYIQITIFALILTVFVSNSSLAETFPSAAINAAQNFAETLDGGNW